MGSIYAHPLDNQSSTFSLLKWLQPLRGHYQKWMGQFVKEPAQCLSGLIDTSLALQGRTTLRHAVVTEPVEAENHLALYRTELHSTLSAQGHLLLENSSVQDVFTEGSITALAQTTIHGNLVCQGSLHLYNTHVLGDITALGDIQFHQCNLEGPVFAHSTHLLVDDCRLGDVLLQWDPPMEQDLECSTTIPSRDTELEPLPHLDGEIKHWYRETPWLCVAPHTVASWQGFRLWATDADTWLVTPEGYRYKNGLWDGIEEPHPTEPPFNTVPDMSNSSTKADPLAHEFSAFSADAERLHLTPSPQSAPAISTSNKADQDHTLVHYTDYKGCHGSGPSIIGPGWPHPELPSPSTAPNELHQQLTLTHGSQIHGQVVFSTGQGHLILRHNAAIVGTVWGVARITLPSAQAPTESLQELRQV